MSSTNPTTGVSTVFPSTEGIQVGALPAQLFPIPLHSLLKSQILKSAIQPLPDVPVAPHLKEIWNPGKAGRTLYLFDSTHAADGEGEEQLSDVLMTSSRYKV